MKNKFKNIQTFEQHSTISSKFKCLKNGHIWSDDETRSEIWRKKSGWYSIGGFPEREERKCIVCGKTEQR